MAKTKTDVEYDQKRDEIRAAATRLFLEVGYDGTSMARLAEEARVAPNTLYWYFADKDALLLAVLDALVLGAFKEFEKRKKSPLDAQLVWVLGVLSNVKDLIATVHSRVAHVETLRVWHDGFHQVIETTLTERLRAHGLAHGHEAHAARATMFVIEGLLAHPSSKRQEGALLKWLVSLVQRDGGDS